MVSVVYNGQAGNNLFQYFLGRCIAKEKGYGLTGSYGVKQVNTVDLKKNILLFNGIKLPKIIEGKNIRQPIKKFNKHIFDWSFVKNNESQIVLDGYFQNYSFYKKYKNFIKKEIWSHNNIFNIKERPGEKDIVLHLRLKEYPYITPIKFYSDILKKENYENAWIITDDHTHSFIKILIGKYGCKIKNTSSENGFLFLANAKKIIMSQSTFCWWAAFISQADIIYFPTVTTQSKGAIWYTNPQRNVDLFVDDEKRYKKIEL
tara:strand:- start:6858 stop:7637 length:780 start_codon:yes stop_codon:yes gene_type:complete